MTEAKRGLVFGSQGSSFNTISMAPSVDVVTQTLNSMLSASSCCALPSCTAPPTPTPSIQLYRASVQSLLRSKGASSTSTTWKPWSSDAREGRKGTRAGAYRAAGGLFGHKEAVDRLSVFMYVRLSSDTNGVGPYCSSMPGSLLKSWLTSNVFWRMRVTKATKEDRLLARKSTSVFTMMDPCVMLMMATFPSSEPAAFDRPLLYCKRNRCSARPPLLCSSATSPPGHTMVVESTAMVWSAGGLFWNCDALSVAHC
mmetsp:Transcript_10572/g.28924  ORF Transcript_10572/g.28924 Transcript_10572/m.28924 type:complete len:255 (+) Transcript_10572:1598-2362(+)